MKDLKRIEFNADRRMTNNELSSLRGGTEPVGSGWECTVSCEGYYEPWFGFASSCDQQDWYCAQNQCVAFFEQQFNGCYCYCYPGS